MHSIYAENTFMRRPLTDPLGHTIYFPPSKSHSLPLEYRDVKEVVTQPSFVIEIKNKAIYFFRMIRPNWNVLIETIRQEGGDFMIQSCQENPSREYISSLLKTGSLIALI